MIVIVMELLGYLWCVFMHGRYHEEHEAGAFWCRKCGDWKGSCTPSP